MKKSVVSWAFYDFGNSAFATTVIAGFFPIFFKKFWSGDVAPEITTGRLGLTLGCVGLLMAVLAPFWGRKSDQSGHRKTWLLSFALVGILSTAGLSLVPQGSWALAILVYAVAYICFEASLIFYDALLPFVAVPEKFNEVSSLGYALGYLGGGILFVFNMVMTLKPELFGLKDATEAVQMSFVTVSVWWLMGLLVLKKGVHETPAVGSWTKEKLTILETYQSLHQTFKKMMKNKNLFYFLLAFWFYIDGVYTVFTMAVDFGLSIGLEQKDLMIALLLVQVVGFPSALAFGYFSRKISIRTLLLSCLFVYSLVLIFSIGIRTGTDFMILACLIGLVQGGIQALSRSYFTHLIPKEHSAEYFGFFNVVGRSASVVGPLLVASITYLSGSARLGLVSIVLLFFLGSYFLWKSRVD